MQWYSEINLTEHWHCKQWQCRTFSARKPSSAAIVHTPTQHTSRHHNVYVRICTVVFQVVVTYTSSVEAFATVIKWNQAINLLFRSRSRDQDEFWVTDINRSTHFLRYLAGVATFCPLNSRRIKQSRASERSDQGWFSPIKILDPGRKRFYRRRWMWLLLVF